MNTDPSSSPNYGVFGELAAYLLAVVLGLLGLMFLIGGQGQLMRYILGIVLLAAAYTVVYLIRNRTRHVVNTVTQKIDLTGDTALERMVCSACQGVLSKKSIEVRAGAIFVNCEYCNAVYQFEEETKW